MWKALVVLAFSRSRKGDKNKIGLLKEGDKAFFESRQKKIDLNIFLINYLL